MKRLTGLLALACLTAGCDAPVSNGARQIPDGSTLYTRHCSACHGRFGEGDGPVALAMSVGMPNLRTLSERADGEFPRDSVIGFIDGRDLPRAHGSRTMPVWGDVFQWGDAEHDVSEAEIRKRIESLVDFLERMQS